VTAGSSAGAGKAGDTVGPEGPTLPGDAGREQVALDLAALVALEEPARDGRVARGQRTRRNVAEALMELLRAGDPDPTAKAVARRAGVSLRLVFHHFADMDDLYQFVAALQLRRQWADMPQLSPKLSLPTRIERTVAHRAALFEETSEVRRALVCRAPTSPAVRQALAAADHLFFEDLKATFAAELADLPPGSRAEYLAAMDTGTSWEAWERLRATSAFPIRGARRVMTLFLEKLCARTLDNGRPGSAVGSTTTS
jgi:TetR/AcrR family transcriptional regulator, regulator of autoinduction and epiphytic fitness